MPRGDELRLRDMLDAAKAAIQTSAGRSQGDLSADRMLALGLTKLIEIIGEAAKNISPATRARAPAVPWDEIIRTRDRLIHGYFSIDVKLIWSIIQNDLPPLVSELEKLLPPPPSAQP